jgi:hypothetical protein
MGGMEVWVLMRFQQLREFCVIMGEAKSLSAVLTCVCKERFFASLRMNI